MRLRSAMCLCLLLSGLTTAVQGQDKHRSSVAKRQHKKPDTAKRKGDKQASAPASTESAAKPAHTENAPASTSKPVAAAIADEDVRKEGGTEVKTLEFGGLDIEGQLRTPQMLYFLNRLRAEFDRPKLPHRSFMPELQRSTKEDTF